MVRRVTATFVAGAAIGFIRFRTTAEPRFAALVTLVCAGDAGITRDAGIGIGIAFLVLGAFAAIESFAATVPYSAALRSQILAGDLGDDTGMLDQVAYHPFTTSPALIHGTGTVVDDRAA